MPGHAGAVRHRHCADPAGHRHAGHGRLCGAERDEPQPLDRGHPRHHDLERGRRHRCAPRLRAGRLGLCQPPVRCGRRLPPRFQHDQALRQAAAARLAGDEPDQGKREKHQDDDLDPERGRRVPQRRKRPARAAHRHADPAPSGAADAENRQICPAARNAGADRHGVGAARHRKGCDRR